MCGMTKTKAKMFPTIFVVALLGVAAWMFAPSIKGLMDPDDGGVSVMVEFDPPHRSGGPIHPGGNLVDIVSVQLILGGTPVGPTERVKRSPWQLVLHPGKRMTIELYAEQFAGGFLHCMIKQHGYPPVNNESVGPSTVRCKYAMM
jgi:hypothetical protein